MNKMKLVTERLVLRNISDKDIKDLIENINNLNVSKWLLVVPYPYTEKNAKWWIDHCKEKDKEYNFCIELKSEKKLIGGIGLSHVDKFQGTAEVGYWLGENYWKKGYGSEALKVLIDFSFNKLKLRKLEAGVFSKNPGSGKLLEKFGFVKEGIRKEARRSKATEDIHDEIMYGLLKKDYKP
jgi:[ribosomal protein S5]-alanine N-acetyltransferase